MPVAARLSGPLRRLGPASLQAAKTALAAGSSWYIAKNVLATTLPVFAPLAALLTVQVTVWESVSRGLQRVLGVVVGVLVAYAFARIVGINVWSIAFVIFVSLLAGRALRLGQQGSVQVPVSALLVLVLGSTTGGYASDRVVDTAVGAGCGILVNLVVVPHTHLDKAQDEVLGFARALAGLLADIAFQLLVAPADWRVTLERARRLGDRQVAAALAVQRTETATRWNPRGRRDRPAVDNLYGAIRALVTVERAARGVARALADTPPGWQLPAPVAGPLAVLLREVAGELSAWSARVTSSGPQFTTEGAASASVDLYRSALVASRSADISPETTAVVCAIAVDAHRISEELQNSPGALPTPPFRWQSLFGS
jgi:uncharacterized membrane protein YgaE (UPF0421/DUF939 family)